MSSEYVETVVGLCKMLALVERLQMEFEQEWIEAPTDSGDGEALANTGNIYHELYWTLKGELDELVG